MTEDTATKPSATAPAKQTEEKAIATLDESYLRNNANVGLEDIAPEDLPTPTLNVIQNNSTLVDAEGRPYPRGKFLYRGNDRLMNDVFCTFLSVTKTEFPDFSNKDEMVKTFVMLGALEPDWKPFILYMKKTGTMAVRQFIGKVKASQVPMFAHRVQLTTEEVKSPKGSYFVIKFNMLGMRKNMDEIVMLEEMAKTYGSHIKTQVQEASQPSVPAEYNDDQGIDVDADDIPF